ncbi:MAG: O-antigen ligase family protein [Candidatus Shapirobacteria bacterium]|nr:O-antigen ligase family protein [Candidatus Shapirobacteria bacterium]MDD3002816.1 O-antigen ligase family protein [Candidatus Shapirobacteria bacterium]MDD4382758.1 O-antigen ligase family protein [Candidatus Shapirobacteria bacterium]
MKSLTKPIHFLFLALVFFTPFIFTQSNSELFELPKMYFVYLLTTLITTFHLINVIQKKAPFRKKTFLDIPILLFFISQVISTYYSIDPHTSFFGYYSRLNGGLLSLICYLLLYFILSVYIDSDFKNKIINFSLLSAFLVSIYAIAEHFGIDKNLWVQDVQSRVFSTLGQPNWLAAYLCIFIPFSIFKFFESIKIDFDKSNKLYGRIMIRPYLYLILTLIFYISLLFTKSKSGIIACLISLAIYFAVSFFKNKPFRKLLILNYSLLIILSLLITNPIKDSFISFIKTRHIVPIVVEDKIPSSKILITSSGDIRKIVWTGAIDLWKKFPIFGTGVETFAYSYYWTRPVEHNLTSEWDYLYNKAHNEYINYLATTGTVGFTTYCFFIISVLFFSLKSPLSKGNLEGLNLVVLASFSSILITNFAGFSVVTTSLFFFLLPTLLNPDQEIKVETLHTTSLRKFLVIPIIIISLFLIKKTIFFYIADIAYNQSEKYDSQNDYQTALSFAQTSHQLNPSEPLYIDKLATIYSKIALNTGKQEYIDQAIDYSDLTIKISPANINFWKQRAQDYLYLSGIDTKYFSVSITALTNAASLAPTDPKIFYSLGQFLETASLTDQAIPYYQKAIELKSNYDYAYFALGKIYLSKKEKALAKENLQKTIDYSYPTNTEAEKLLKSL